MSKGANRNHEEQPLANRVLGSKSEEAMKIVMEAVAKINVAIGKDEEYDRLLAEKEGVIREMEARAASWKSKWEESKRAHDEEIARMQRLQEQAKEQSNREKAALEEEWKKRMDTEMIRLLVEHKDTISKAKSREAEFKHRHDTEMDRLRRVHEQEQKERSEEYEKRISTLEQQHLEREEEIKKLGGQIIRVLKEMEDSGQIRRHPIKISTRSSRFVRPWCCVAAVNRGAWCDQCKSPVHVRF